MSKRYFGNTKLAVTGVLIYQNQTCLWREERGQSLVLVALEDERTGEKGHVLYQLEVDKRDILEEETYTDNPKLFAKEHPEGSDLQDLLSLPDGNTPTERTEEIEDILAACWNGDNVEYKEGDAGWGLYA
jgi:hypothetical protein